MNKKRLVLLVATALVVTALLGCTREDLEKWAKVLVGVWRASGNSVLTLEGNGQKTFSVNLEDEQYPIDVANDDAFLTEARIRAEFDLDTLERFTLLCGTNNADNLDGDIVSLTTTIVFWSDDNWAGTPTRFLCGGTQDSDDYEITGSVSVSEARSICVVTDLTPQARRERCLNGAP